MIFEFALAEKLGKTHEELGTMTLQEMAHWEAYFRVKARHFEDERNRITRR